MDSFQLLYLFESMEESLIGGMINDSTWLFPVIQALHLIGLAILGGSIVVGDLRLIGFVFKQHPIDYVIKQTVLGLRTGLIVMIITGIPLFLSEAIKCYYSRAFWIKMSALVIGLAFTFLVRNPMAIKKKLDNKLNAKLIGFTSFSVWAVVAGAGRWIGFS